MNLCIETEKKQNKILLLFSKVLLSLKKPTLTSSLLPHTSSAFTASPISSRVL